MPNNSLYKSFTIRPHAAVKTATGESVDVLWLLQALADEAGFISDYAWWELTSNATLRDSVTDYSGYSNNHKIGEALGIGFSRNVENTWEELRAKHEMTGRVSGRSRREWLLHDRVVSEAKSWVERSTAARRDSSRYVSSGWRRTADATAPQRLAPKLRLSCTDKQYARIVNDPFSDGTIALDMVVWGQWFTLFFRFDAARFCGGERVCLPDVTVRQGRAVFHFAVEYAYLYKRMSSRYVVGVDVGVSHYATMVVTDEDGGIVHAMFLSENVRLLAKSVAATRRQIAALAIKKRSAPWVVQKELSQEIRRQREANTRKKRQLAILAAQEIAYISHVWGNAVVVFEDLSWIRNTMEHGRWNRGELLSRTREYVELNGGRVITVNAAYTSQRCHHCGEKVAFRNWHTAVCPVHGVADRDINAAANIANRARATVTKMVVTRSKARQYSRHKDVGTLRTPVPGVPSVRDKRVATGKCDNKKRGRQFRRARKRFVEGVNFPCGTSAHVRCVTVSLDAQQSKCCWQDPEKATLCDCGGSCALGSSPGCRIT